MVPSFNTDVRHCHRFSVLALFFACFSCSSGMTTFSTKRTKAGSAFRSLRAGPYHLPCIGHVSAVATIPLLPRFQLGTHPFDLKRRFRRYPSQKASESAVPPFPIFPTPREKQTNMLSSCGKWAGTVFLSSTSRRSGHTAGRWILITRQQHRHGASFPHGAPFPSQN